MLIHDVRFGIYETQHISLYTAEANRQKKFTHTFVILNIRSRSVKVRIRKVD